MEQGELGSLETTAPLAAPHLSGTIQILLMHLFVPQAVQAARQIQGAASRQEGLVGQYQLQLVIPALPVKTVRTVIAVL